MYSSVRIQSFRGIGNLELSDLGRTNLIVGANDVGKSSVLEALALLHMHLDGTELVQILRARGFRSDESLEGSLAGFVHSGQESTGLRVSALAGDRRSMLVGELVSPRAAVFGEMPGRYRAAYQELSSEAIFLTYTSEPEIESPSTLDWNAPAVNIVIDLGKPPAVAPAFAAGHFGNLAFLPALSRLTSSNLAEILTRLFERGNTDDLFKAIREFDVRIEKLYVGYSAKYRQPVVGANIHGVGGVPIQHLGEGVRRLIDISTLLPLAAGGVTLIDEIDFGIYFENLPKLWSMIDRLSSSSNTQVFATTHSQECVRAFLSAVVSAGAEEHARVIRLERSSFGLDAVVVPASQARSALNLGLEIR